MNNKKGFTLIELIVVIAILGVLALILVPNFMGYLADAKETTATTNAANAYKMATAAAAKGQTNSDGGITATEVKDKLVADDTSYGNAGRNLTVTCETFTSNSKTLCKNVKSVTLTSSGITAEATNGGSKVVSK
ncbi:MAG: type II secretion system protein [Erysipelotrichaceae bacterium]